MTRRRGPGGEPQLGSSWFWGRDIFTPLSPAWGTSHSPGGNAGGWWCLDPPMKTASLFPSSL